ncbi:restriction endonuclease subunit S [Winogradskyella sediminis]|uniref:restriction endonuclease subunit S n=1 Tax=Winogradskyella sediminis TaxID=1382466 RepID=UPI003AA7BB53
MPQNWKTYKLEDISDIKSGKRLPKGHTLISEKTDFPYIRLVDINENAIDEKSIMYLLPETKIKIQKYIVNTNDICLAIVGHTIGLVFYINEKFDEYNLTENAARLTNFSKNINSKFIYYNLLSPQGYHNILSRKVGSAQGKLPLYNIKSFELNLPPLPEQKAIAQILSAIDDKIENNLAINKTMEEMAMALYKHWFVDFGPFQDGAFVESELGEIPEGWEVKRLPKIATFHNKKRKPISTRERAKIQGVYPYYGATKILDYLDHYNFEGEFILLAEDGTVKTNGDTPYLQFVNGKFCVSNHAHVLTGASKYSNEFLFLSLNNKNIIPIITGAVQLKINKENLKTLEFIVPKEKDLKIFEGLIIPLYKKIKQIELENQTLTKLRNTLLPKLISGEVRLKEFREAFVGVE